MSDINDIQDYMKAWESNPNKSFIEDSIRFQKEIENSMGVPRITSERRSRSIHAAVKAMSAEFMKISRDKDIDIRLMPSVGFRKEYPILWENCSSREPRLPVIAADVEPDNRADDSDESNLTDDELDRDDDLDDDDLDDEIDDDDLDDDYLDDDYNYNNEVPRSTGMNVSSSISEESTSTESIDDYQLLSSLDPNAIGEIPSDSFGELEPGNLSETVNQTTVDVFDKKDIHNGSIITISQTQDANKLLTIEEAQTLCQTVEQKCLPDKVTAILLPVGVKLEILNDTALHQLGLLRMDAVLEQCKNDTILLDELELDQGDICDI